MQVSIPLVSMRPNFVLLMHKILAPIITRLTHEPETPSFFPLSSPPSANQGLIRPMSL